MPSQQGGSRQFCCQAETSWELAEEPAEAGYSAEGINARLYYGLGWAARAPALQPGQRAKGRENLVRVLLLAGSLSAEVKQMF